MKINIHAGHNPDGKIACGAVGLIKESTEARKVVALVAKYLREKGHTVYNCTCNNGTGQSDVLHKIVKKCNAHKVDLDVSVHFNSGAKDKKGNGKSTGTEVLIYSSASKAKTYAQRTVNAIAGLGFKNRGVKVRNGLYVLSHTDSPSMLVECCFVDDKDDTTLYNATKMAKAIYKGITGEEYKAASKKKAETKKAYSGKLPSKTLKKGDKGNDVLYLQEFLNWYGNYGLKLDKDFGSKTEAAVEKFQKATGLTVDGIFGSKSKAKAKSIKK